MRKFLCGIVLVSAVLFILSGCGKETSILENGGSMTDDSYAALSPGAKEEAYENKLFFRPTKDGDKIPYVGDPMPYYEDGTYYIYYLKDGGDSFNHSVYLTTTEDFTEYKEYDDPILKSGTSGQDNWIGTGSVVKTEDSYYFFYTGHNDTPSSEYVEKVMVAKGSDLKHFEKIDDWDITPPAELGQKRDFRDPQAYYDSKTGKITLTITAAMNGKARILKYTLSKDLTEVNYDGIIFTDETGTFWNLECSDTFKIGNTWYLTYSAQDDTLWYAKSDEAYGPYSKPQRLDGKLFYAAKHVENGKDGYMVGWARRSTSVISTSEVSGWAGNLVAQKIEQKENGDLVLTCNDDIAESFKGKKGSSEKNFTLEKDKERAYEEIGKAPECFMVKGKLSFEGMESFGMAFDYNGSENKYKLIEIDPKDKVIRLTFNNGSNFITETSAFIEAGKTYDFTYIQDGSTGVFYLDKVASLTVRLYGVTGRNVMFYSDNSKVWFTKVIAYKR